MSTIPVHDGSEDEFGDASFLADVDLDAVASSEKVTASNFPPNKKQKVATNSYYNNNDNPHNGNYNYNDNDNDNHHYQQHNKDYNTPHLPSKEELEQTLTKFFGYTKFRAGQLPVIQSIIGERNRDAAVFWATGSGKSICYQIPALHTGKVTLVVSPLISLMQDQVNKLNGLVSENDEDLATFLGSGQSDGNKEFDAMKGKFLLIYVTPEKLLSDGFLDQLAKLHTTKREIGLIACDEAHVVSEWGHDFRPEFRRIGDMLRGPQSTAPYELQQIPIIALTATAVPRVQDDICRSLHLRPNIKMVRQSFDRKNLVISVHKKERTMALAAAMEPLITSLTESTGEKQSTIIYVPTRSQVDTTVAFLRQRLQQQHRDDNILVEGYHAGMSMSERTISHTNFLTGKTTVICATVAFGMGIDKPDTRRVIHFGPPKTVEEYYQQIGRAGRDGIKAECIMYVSESDFDNYKSDFYLGNLSGPAKQAVVESIDALKTYSLGVKKCRRKALLDFFREPAAFGERCGTCDVCQKYATLGENDLERDFGHLGARVVLQAVSLLKEPAVSIITKVIAGSSVESYRYKYNVNEAMAEQKISEKKNVLSKKLSHDMYRELLVSLTQNGYLSEATKSKIANGYSRAWATYSITPKGTAALANENIPILLPVPESVLKAERIEKAKREQMISRLKESGVQIEKLPQEEVEAGDGDVIRAYSKWKSYLEMMRRNERDDRVAELEDLLQSLEKWRAEVAIRYRMAPGSVLAEHTLLTLSYTTATMPKGMKMDQSTLLTAGVRTKEMSSLCKVLDEWVDKYQSAETKSFGVASAADGAQQGGDRRMLFVPGEVVQAKEPWKYFEYKPMKKTGLASWESSYMRFMEGENPQSIALSPANGRPIQVQTVCSHIIQGLLYGRPVDLNRLTQFLPAPTASEWEQLQAAEIETGIDVCGNPLNCGPGGDKFTKTEFLRPIMGNEFTDTPYAERDEAQKATFGLWCHHLDWYMNLRRIAYEPIFE